MTNVFVAIDLEFTQPTQKIIQLGYCIGNVRTKEILEKGSWFINPEEQLTDYIKNLTGITQEQVNDGYTPAEAVRQLQFIADSHNAHRQVITWGRGDVESLLQYLKQDDAPVKFWTFGRRYFDTKTIYQARMLGKGMSMEAGLQKAMVMEKLVFQGRPHNAEADAHNTFLLFCHLIKGVL